jgi:putative two-component system response regulator
VILMRWGDPSRILIADDSTDQVRIVRRVLSAEGYACSSVDDGRAAFEACAAGRVDVVLLDLHMPGWDGLTVCRKLKSTPETCLIPVLMMTGASLEQSHLEAIEAGADDFLPKPLALPELRARVRSATRMKRYIDELDNAAASIVMLGATIEARDVHTSGHCQRLSEFASIVGCSAATLDAIHAPGSRPSPCRQAPRSAFQASSKEHPLQRPSADRSCS